MEKHDLAKLLILDALLPCLNRLALLPSCAPCLCCDGESRGNRLKPHPGGDLISTAQDVCTTTLREERVLVNGFFRLLSCPLAILRADTPTRRHVPVYNSQPGKRVIMQQRLNRTNMRLRHVFTCREHCASAFGYFGPQTLGHIFPIPHISVDSPCRHNDEGDLRGIAPV